MLFKYTAAFVFMKGVSHKYLGVFCTVWYMQKSHRLYKQIQCETSACLIVKIYILINIVIILFQTKTILIQQYWRIGKVMEWHGNLLVRTKVWEQYVVLKHGPLFLPQLPRLKDGAAQSVALEAGVLASSRNPLGGYGEDGGLSASSPAGSAPGSASSSGIHHASLCFWEVTDDFIKSWGL